MPKIRARARIAVGLLMLFVFQLRLYYQIVLV